MAMSPDEVRNKTFSIVKKGYERGEVHRFLDDVARQLNDFTTGSGGPTDAVVIESPPAPEPLLAVAPLEEPEPAPEPAPAPAPAPEPEPAPEPITFEPAPEPEPVAQTAASFSGADGFDRVGNEISLMLRQAQESALKIRSDAEVEARTLIDQVRLDIESDRAAHEAAAAELVSRTEQRAAEIRAEAEAHSVETRTSADEYSTMKRAEAETYQRDTEVAADADRKLAAEKLESAKREAEATIMNANATAEATIADAEKTALKGSRDVLEKAQMSMNGFVDAERESRSNLEAARNAIESALAQLKIAEIEMPTPTAGD
jgi:DivIVA domain-containing protein